jgi:hypothetical protein
MAKKPTSAATEARKARELAERKKREAYALQLHNERVAKLNATKGGRRVMGVRRSAPAPEPVPLIGPGTVRAWWCQPGVIALMERQRQRTAQHPRPGVCPHCGGTRIKWQTDLENGTVLFVCPVDWSPAIMNTGCGGRFAFNPETGTKSTVTNQTHSPLATGDEEEPPMDWPDLEGGDIR